MKKRILCLALVMVMIFTLLPMSAFAVDVVAEGTCGGNLTWTLDSEGTLTISGTGAMDDYSDDDPPWYDKIDEIETVVIESGVTTIGDYAFIDCDNLTSVTIPNSVTSIGKRAFKSCSSLTSVTIPDSVITIGEYAFLDCSRLTGIWVDDANAKYSSDEHGVLFNKDKTELICCPGGYDGPYTIPGSVTSVGDHAFSNCSNLTSVTIGSGVTNIGGGAFYGCSSLTSVTIPNSVTTIGDYAFFNCYNLTSVTIGNGVTSIGDYAFSYCSSLTSINVDNNNKYYSSSGGVLFDKNQTILICYPAGKTESNYTIPDSVTYIDVEAFFLCINLTSVTIPDSVTSIGEAAFYGCSNLTSITIPDSVTTIGDYAFNNCDNLTSVTIGSGVTSIGDWAFSLCSSLTSVTIGSGVTTIGGWAFTLCSSLTSVTIPNSVTSIGYYAFSDCSSLTDVYYGGSEKQWNEISIKSGNDDLTNATIHYSGTDEHEHIYTFAVTEPTCTAQGYTTHTCTCGDSYVDSYTNALGHSFGEWTVTTAPTCTEKGVETRYCLRCDAFEAREVDALGHDLVHHDGKAATCTEAGWEDYDACSRCDHTTYKEISALGHNYKNGVCTVCGAKDPDYKPPVVKENPFVDVSESSVYYDAILWAYYHEPQQITGGYTATEFRPGNPCTRGQVVTFLWRAAGCPEPTGNINVFKDASSIAAPYQKAVAWAVEKGITTGFTDGTFRPNDSVTRAQFVTFLWRYEGKPATSGSIAGFTDAASISGPYQQAVAWAVEKGITTGYNDGTFRPNDTCTRWAVVLFMYRDMA